MYYGANYQADVATFLGVLALVENVHLLPSAISRQTPPVRVGAEQPWAIDDLAVWFGSGSMAWAQAKASLTAKDIPDVADQIVRQFLHGRERTAGTPLIPDDHLVVAIGDASDWILRDLREVLYRIRELPVDEHLDVAIQGASHRAAFDRVAKHVSASLAARGISNDDSMVRRVLSHVSIWPITQDDATRWSVLLLEMYAVTEAEQAPAALAVLQRRFSEAGQHRTSYDVARIRSLLIQSGVTLKAPRGSGTTLPSPSRLVDVTPAPIRSILDEGRKLMAEGHYGSARERFDVARDRAAKENCHAAVIEARLDVAEANLCESRNILESRAEILACLAESGSEIPGSKRRMALDLLGDAELLLGHIEEAKSLYREVQTLAQAQRDRAAEAHSLMSLSHTEELAGNLSVAHRLLDEATESYRSQRREATGDDLTIAATNLAATFATKARLFEHEGKLNDALSALSRSEPLFREANSYDNLGRTLLMKGRLLLAEGHRDEGLSALKDALSTFEIIGQTAWQCRSLSYIARVLLGNGNQRAAFACVARALFLAESGMPGIETVPYFLQLAHLFEDHRQSEFAKNLIGRALQVSTTADDDWLISECLIAEGRTLGTKTPRDALDALFRRAARHTNAALLKCEIKGLRAQYTRRLGQLHGWLGEIDQARHWLEQALREYEEIGDLAGMGETLALLAAAAREDHSPAKAISIFERLVAFCEGKPLYYHRAGALHDLATLQLSQGDLTSAKSRLVTAQAIAERHRFADVLEAVAGTMEQLEAAERLLRPPQSDFASLILELHHWASRYPELRDAILPLWYFVHSADLWSICRSLLGVKFVICAPDRRSFTKMAALLQEHGDLFVWGAKAPLKKRQQTELIPWSPEVLIPPHLNVVAFRGSVEGVELDVIAKAVVARLSAHAYVLIPFSGTMKTKAFHDTNMCALGRHIRLPVQISKMMLDTHPDRLIARQHICLPLTESATSPSLLHVMRVAYDNQAIPVYHERLPYGDGVDAVCDTVLSAETLRVPKTARSAPELKELWNSLLLSCSKEARSALSAFSRGMDSLLEMRPLADRVSLRIYALRFEAGDQQVVHPALVVEPR